MVVDLQRTAGFSHLQRKHEGQHVQLHLAAQVRVGRAQCLLVVEMRRDVPPFLVGAQRGEHVALTGPRSRRRNEGPAMVERCEHAGNALSDALSGREQGFELPLELRRLVEVAGERRLGQVQVAAVEPRAEFFREPGLQEGRLVALQPRNNGREGGRGIDPGDDDGLQVTCTDSIEGVRMPDGFVRIDFDQAQEAAQGLHSASGFDHGNLSRTRSATSCCRAETSRPPSTTTSAPAPTDSFWMRSSPATTSR